MERLYQVCHSRCESQLAEAFARKAFPSSGVYASAGWEPATELNEACRSFLESHGYDLAEARPKPIDRVASDLGSYHVIVSFEGDPRQHVPRAQFRTILLQWGVVLLALLAANRWLATRMQNAARPREAAAGEELR